MKPIKIFLTVVIISFFSSCKEKTSTNPNEIYQLWTGVNPSKEIKVINGQYWESVHWTKEYVLFMELQTDNFFWDKFKK